MSDIQETEVTQDPELIPAAEVKNVEMIKEAALLADFLVKCSGKVKRVGLSGSLARGKKDPGDIDLVVFVDDEVAQKYFKNALDKKYQGETLMTSEEIAKHLGFDRDVQIMWEMCLSQISFPIDFQVIPDDPSSGSAILWAELSLDPTFLENITKTKMYHSETEQFVQEEAYTSEQLDLIRKASFLRLKKILGDKDEYDKALGRMERSPSHRKRLKHPGLHQQDGH